MKKLIFTLVVIVVVAVLGIGLVGKKLALAPGEGNGLQRVRLYYYNEQKDQDSEGNILCSRQGLEAVEREVAPSETTIEDTVRLLLAGNLTPEEKSRGLSTEYPLAGFSLVSSELNNGVLTLTFSDPNNRTVGGACRVGILWFQIEATAKQFPPVKQVRFLPQELFQP